jgi:hypothetical protein
MAKRKTGKALAPWQDSIEEKRERIYREAPAALQKKIDWLQKWFDKEARDSIKRHYELGQAFKEIHDDATKYQGKTYGIHAVDQIKDYFGWDEGVIYNCMRMVQNFTKEEIDELCAMRMPNGQRLYYSHLLTFLMVADKVKRRQLIERAVAENWTSRQLVYEAAPELAPKKPMKGGRGRPIGIPETFDAVRRQQEQFCDIFLSRAAHVWDTDENGLQAKAADLATADFTEARAGAVRVLADKLAMVSDMAKKLQQQALSVQELMLKGIVRPQLKVVVTTEGPKDAGQPEPKDGNP